MSIWLWFLLGSAIAIVVAGFYPCFLISKKVIQLKKDATKDVKELGEFDGEVEIFIPLEMVNLVTEEDLEKRRGLVTYHVLYIKNNWAIKRGKNKTIYAQGANKELVTKLAIEYAKRDKAELKIHNKKGRIKISNSYGRDPKGNG
jgi:hypothetical protein